MKKAKKKDRLVAEDVQELLEGDSPERPFGDDLRRLHLVLDLVCLVEAQLPENGLPDELLGAVLNLRDRVTDRIAEVIRERISLVKLP